MCLLRVQIQEERWQGLMGVRWCKVSPDIPRVTLLLTVLPWKTQDSMPESIFGNSTQVHNTRNAADLLDGIQQGPFIFCLYYEMERT